jgi:hypothetical protein
MALNIILAEKVEGCPIGCEFCTYIPNNTATDGTVTKDLQAGEPY